jgi:CelD/BcsL family acetyltransferase involved in cellulose biosynthesis
VSELRIIKWNESQFAQGSSQWSELLSQFSGDNVFLTWDWMYQWWLNRKNTKTTLFIWAVFSGEQLVGIAPLYIEPDYYFRGLLKSNRLQFLGTRLNGSSGIRSEYQQFILHDDFRQEALNLILRTISDDRSWSECYLGDFVSDGFQSAIVQQCFGQLGYHQRIESDGPTFVVSPQGSYQDYIASLGKNTRLKLHNRRKLLATLGDVQLVDAGRDQLTDLIVHMNQKHNVRWGKPAFTNTTSQFLKELLAIPNSNLTLLTSSLLTLDDRVISVIFNIEYKATVYNIQLGFEQELHPKISVGTLHLGYSIENAFERGLHRFDLLEGSGKNDDYKKRIATPDTQLTSYRYIRSPLLKSVFKLYDRFLRH